MLSKRAGIIKSQEPKRVETDIHFIPSTRRDMMKSVNIFLREVNAPEYPFQMTIVFGDNSLGRLGYYDLSYKDWITAYAEYKKVVARIKELRERIEFNQESSVGIEKSCRAAVDSVLENAVAFDSTYVGKYRGKNLPE